jgi:hypothetical protein
MHGIYYVLFVKKLLDIHGSQNTALASLQLEGN